MVGLEHVQGAGCAPVGQRIDEHQGVETVEQVVGQVHPRDSVVGDTDRRVAQPRRDTA